MAENGATVIVNHSNSKNEAKETLETIIKNGGEAMEIQADVSKKEHVVTLFDKTIETYGKVDVLINNAGIMYNEFLKDHTQDEFSKLFDVNVRGVFNTLQEAAHAQLYRILASGNKTEYNLSTEEYNWLQDLNIWWWDYSKMPEITAQHDFIVTKYAIPIANAIRKFDSYRYSLDNYLYFGREGLFDEGKNGGLITREEFSRYSTLKEVPLIDNYTITCD
ncbi:SDR family NAD(P)-dependent oxidoreductase [Joostella atrarenae]|uniref:SDR family NAD(P)-dependent oxidoreductase n=1 Tax=Joostella atrarenae TaxID=679257 RepID=UPI001F415481|nr:SDR family NAD(P)-dependent oxidoreductase [Joostella atrarenae]